MSFVTDAFALKAKSIIKNLEKRNMEGFYCENSQALLDTILPMIENNSSIAWGGSQTLNECGLMDALQQSGSYTMIDRTTAKSPEEARQIFAKSVLADYYLMSTNAITLDGELINIDGNGNRVACLIQGPKQVFIIAGMNKVVTDIGTGLSRVQKSPPRQIHFVSIKKRPAPLQAAAQTVFHRTVSATRSLSPGEAVMSIASRSF